MTTSGNPLRRQPRRRGQLLPSDTIVYDHCGHGTHVAGIIAGNGSLSTGSAIRTPSTASPATPTWSTCRVLDQNGQGTRQPGRLRPPVGGRQQGATYNIRVINLSLGHPVGESYTTDPLCQAVEAAYKAGIVVVCAAGNNGRLNSGQHGRRGQRRLGNGLRLHQLARQRPVCHHRRGHQETWTAYRADDTHRHLFQPGPDPPGPGDEARPGRPRQPGHLHWTRRATATSATATAATISCLTSDVCQDGEQRPPSNAYCHAVRHLHGGAGRLRARRR